MILDNRTILKNEKNNYQNNIKLIINLFVIVISFISALLIFFDFNKPYYYSALPLLPIIFSLLNLMIFPVVYKNLFSNIGFTLIVLLMFFRLSICPLIMMLGNYEVIINLNISENTPKAVFLMIYEAIIIYGVFILFFSKREKKSFSYIKEANKAISKIHINLAFKIVLIILSIIFIAILFYVPGLKDLYRTIFNIDDKYYTHLTATYIINKYGTTFYKKGALVIGIYIFKILRLLVPATILIMIKNKTNEKIALPLSILVIFTQFLIVDDTIARSFYYAFILFLLLTFLFPKKANKLIFYSFLFSALSVGFYFLIRYYTTKDYTNFFSYLSRVSNNYFSGVNITSGIFNLPRNPELRWLYFISDHLEAIPFGNTVLGFDNDLIQNYFNSNNGVFGQIPTTISCGYYYFGVIFAPLYSMLFAFLSLYGGEKVLKTDNLLEKVIWLYFSLVMSLGIVMYNITITLVTLSYILIPMLIIKKALKKVY